MSCEYKSFSSKDIIKRKRKRRSFPTGNVPDQVKSACRLQCCSSNICLRQYEKKTSNYSFDNIIGISLYVYSASDLLVI